MKQLTLGTVGFERSARMAAGEVAGRDGAGGAVVGIERSDRAGLSETGQWPSTDREL
jgi:hypothetical protein